MARFVAGDVVVLPFPYTDQSDSKKRPALVLRQTKSNDLLVCMISSAAYGGSDAIALDEKNMASAGLRVQSSIRPDRILVVSPSCVEKKTGRVSRDLTDTVKSAIISWLQGNDLHH